MRRAVGRVWAVAGARRPAPGSEGSRARAGVVECFSEGATMPLERGWQGRGDSWCLMRGPLAFSG